MSPDELAGLTIDAARRAIAGDFRRIGIATGDLDARLLVGAAMHLDHAGLIRHGPSPLGIDAAAVLSRAMARRMAGEPVSRILGRREFWGLPFSIGPEVLDPRADTEGLVGAVLDALGGRCDDPLTLLDLGTGSGAILCALLVELPMARGLGFDLSGEACRIAAANVAANGLSGRASIVRGFWLDAIGGRFDAIVSNPPYIPTGDLSGLAREVRDHDPRGALDGGPDGLDAYRAIVPLFLEHLVPGGIAAVECGFDQGRAVAKMFADAGLEGVMTYRDLAGLDRVVLAQSPRLSPSEEVLARKTLGDLSENA